MDVRFDAADVTKLPAQAVVLGSMALGALLGACGGGGDGAQMSDKPPATTFLAVGRRPGTSGDATTMAAPAIKAKWTHQRAADFARLSYASAAALIFFRVFRHVLPGGAFRTTRRPTTRASARRSVAAMNA